MEERPTERRRFPWLRWLRRLCYGLAVFVAWKLAWRWYDIHKATKEFEAVAAELDRSDPGWRWEEIEARRENIPPEENSAERILAAAKLLPPDWPGPPAPAGQPPAGNPIPGPKRPPDLQSVLDQLKEIEPNYQLTEDLTDDLRAQVHALAEPIAAVRTVNHLPRGRFSFQLAHNPIDTLVPHIQKVRDMSAVLHLDAVFRIRQEGGEKACDSIQAIVYAARSVGDEPFLISVLVRIASVRRAVEVLERVLGQGELSPEILRRITELSREEEAEAQRALLAAVRGERAMHNVLLQRMADGELLTAEFGGMHKPTFSDKLAGWYVGRPVAISNRAPMLRYMTEIVQLSRLSRGQRGDRVEEIEQEVRWKKNEPKYMLCALLIPALGKVLDAHDRHLALLRCARTALAAENFRLSHPGRWPQTVDELVPDFLNEVPINPFTDEPVEMEERQGILLISAPGSEGAQDAAPFVRGRPKTPTPLVRFRLWKPESRGVPPDQIP